MSRNASASSCSVRRSRRPQARLETSCTRTGRPRRHLRLKPGRRSAGEGLGHTARVRLRGVTLRRSTDEPFEQRPNLVGGEWGGKAADQGEHFLTRHVPDTERDCACPTGGPVCGPATYGRYSSKIRTGCANERPSGSVRGAPGNWCPYRDLIGCRWRKSISFPNSALRVRTYPFI